jgi:hypothetical protein
VLHGVHKLLPHKGCGVLAEQGCLLILHNVELVI